jgi:putative transposase
VLRRPVEIAQCTAADYAALLAGRGIAQSLGRPGTCWDNAVAESFFASLKLELIDRQGWATRAQVRHAAFDYIERFYKRQRLHSTLGYLTPAEYESNMHHHKAAQAA